MRNKKKKSLMPILGVSLYFIVSITVIILAYQGVKLQYDKMLRDKVLSEKDLTNKVNLAKSLMAEYDKYSSEERIAPFAIENLNMTKDNLRQIIVVDKKKADKLKEIESQINIKYE